MRHDPIFDTEAFPFKKKHAFDRGRARRDADIGICASRRADTL
jgi:hypothetical protein